MVSELSRDWGSLCTPMKGIICFFESVTTVIQIVSANILTRYLQFEDFALFVSG